MAQLHQRKVLYAGRVLQSQNVSTTKKKTSILLPVSTASPTPQTPMFSVFFSSIPGTLYVIKILLYIDQTGQIAQNHTRNQRCCCSNFEFSARKSCRFHFLVWVHHLDGGGGGHFRKHHHRALENLLFFPLCAFFLLRATQIQLITGFRISTPRSGTWRTNLSAGYTTARPQSPTLETEITTTQSHRGDGTTFDFNFS